MADLKVTYTLTTPGPDIIFNDGTLGDGTDKYWIQNIRGLDGPSIRAPVDVVPFGDGGIVHTFRKGPRRVLFDGIYLIESSTSQGACQDLRNDLHFQLLAALESIIDATGTLAWTATGQGALSLTVFNEVPLEAPYSDNYAVQNFSFGLISEAAEPA